MPTPLANSCFPSWRFKLKLYKYEQYESSLGRPKHYEYSICGLLFNVPPAADTYGLALHIDAPRVVPAVVEH